MKLTKNQRYLISAGILAFLMILLVPKESKWTYDFRKGSPWNYETLISEFDFPIYKTQEQMAQERLKGDEEVIGYYKYSEEIVNRSIKSLEGLSLDEYSAVRPVMVSVARKIFDRGIISEDRQQVKSSVIYIQRNKRASKVPYGEVYKISDARAKFLADVAGEFPRLNIDSLMRKSGAYDMLVPNVIYDQHTTSLVHSESSKTVSPTLGFVKTGDIIVSSGEIVTADIAQILESYKREYESSLGYSGSIFLRLVGDVIIVLAIVALLLVVLKIFEHRIIEDSGSYNFIFTVVLISMIMISMASRFKGSAIYLFPFEVCILYCNAFFRSRVSIIVYAVALLPMLVMFDYGGALYLMYFASGMLVLFLSGNFTKRWQQFAVAAINFVFLVLLYSGLRWVGALNGTYGMDIFFLLLGSFICVAASTLIYLFEKVFNLTSISRLMDLCDTSNPLIHKLETMAPGTFQHSIQVMNMGDAVAQAIGANRFMVRAGALYHDIGKMANPLCFVENESIVHTYGTEKYHDSISPTQSARDIIAHVTDGVEMARKGRLPQSVVDMIASHHGTTCVSYFYDKYLKQGGTEDRKPEFCYPGPKPKTREQVILMMCDSIEAASRTLKDHSPESISKLVENIAKSKLADGQIYDADITLGEIETAKETIKSYLLQIYHARIAYPKK